MAAGENGTYNTGERNELWTAKHATAPFVSSQIQCRRHQHIDCKLVAEWLLSRGRVTDRWLVESELGMLLYVSLRVLI